MHVPLYERCLHVPLYERCLHVPLYVACMCICALGYDTRICMVKSPRYYEPVVSALHTFVQLHFTPSSVKAYNALLVVDIQEAGKNVFSLPITAKSIVPPIQLLTPLLDYGRCFLKHSYSGILELLNNSGFPVKYSMCPQVDKSLLIYSSAQSSGVIAPHTTHSVELLIETQAQGEIITSALIDILGSTDLQLEVAIACIGEGPVINVRPDSLEWGVCPVLTPITKRVMLSNESLIPAEFECVLVSA